MRKIIFVFLMSALCLNMFSQGRKSNHPTQVRSSAEIDSNANKPVYKVSQPRDSSVVTLIAQQSIIHSDLDSIKRDLTTIKANTKPPSVLGEFLENKVLEKLYDVLFGGEDKPGLIPFILSVIGLVLGLIRFIVLIVRFRKIKGEKLQKIQGVVIAFLLFITSALLFILTNRNFKSAESVQLDKLDREIAAIRFDIQANQAIGIRTSNDDSNTSAFAIKLDKCAAQLQEMNRLVKQSEGNILNTVKDKSTHGWWIFFNTILLLFILFKDKIRQLFEG